MRKTLLQSILLLVCPLLLPTQIALAGAAAPAVDVAGAKASLLCETSGGAPAFSYHAEEKLPVGGLTRLPALLAVCEGVDQGKLTLTQTITVSEEAAAIKGPSAFLAAYERIEASALMKAAVMICAGDAIHALSEAAYGSAAACLQQMQARLAQLGIEAGYTGLLGAEVRLSAEDLVRLGGALMQSPTFLAYSNLYYEEITHEGGRVTQLANANKLLKSYVGCGGVATGSSQEAGYCGVFSVNRNGVGYVCAVIGAPDSNARFKAAKNALDYGFTAFDVRRAAKAGDVLAEGLPVRGARQNTVALLAAQDIVLLLPHGESYDTELTYEETLRAPLLANVPVGEARFLDSRGAILATLQLVPAQDMPAAGLFDFVALALIDWVHG
ncbi:MAG: serine hydrolase [Christensenellaceae bacterium]|jgi:D-alanyl-D-alanine carboxypeptidase (penicillin-binding protein 5/6)|nr:serine hydrolase [Christensenellaceae bacterium]